MAIGIKVCRVCGKEYEACHTLRPNLNNEFRWQDVACCPEHGAEYLRQILISRGELTEEQPAEEKEEAAKPATAPKKRNRKKKDSEDAVQAAEE